jgi:GR25 family glycosyltransferase involved in LPS biosynthesis
MNVNVINLDHRTDRLAEMYLEFEKHKLELVRHQGVNGLNVFIKEAKNKRMRGHFGCLQSFRNLLKNIKGTSEYHIIMEDDVILIDDFKDSVLNHIKQAPKDWDMIYFGGHIKTLENAIEEYDDLFWKAKNVLGLYCWVIKDSSIDGLLNIFNSRLWKADILAIEYQNIAKVYITKKCHAWIRESFSDISQDVISPQLKY